MGEKNSDVSIKINEDRNELLAADIKSNIPAKRSALSYIYRVPARLRAAHTKVYDPCAVSIGPFHSKKILRISEDHKKWYLCDLIARSDPERDRIQDMVKSVRGLELEARKCYAEEFDEISSDDFVKMMILDGCFILELLFKYKEYTSKSKEESTHMHSSANQNHDPVFSATWIVRSLQRDLVLLENQLPFIILETLFELITDCKCISSLTHLILCFLRHEIPSKSTERGDTKMIRGEHILDLLRNHLLPSSKPMKYGVFPNWKILRHTATDLREAGVRFETKRDAKNFVDITFTNYGVLEIPPILYGEGMIILLPNLIALEQCHRYYADQITSYAIFLDTLINSKEDVRLLRKSEIIDVLWNDDQTIASDINNLCKGARIDEFYYDELSYYLNEHCRTRWNKWRAILKRNYFGTPWAVLSFAAALVLLILTFAQTLFAIRPIDF